MTAFVVCLVVGTGAVHSPAILQRSGVAPSSVLQELGTDKPKQVADLPVGQGFQDHPGSHLVIAFKSVDNA
jgi:choline dehydrogenase